MSKSLKGHCDSGKNKNRTFREYRVVLVPMMA